jgi:hypothetical protein
MDVPEMSPSPSVIAQQNYDVSALDRMYGLPNAIQANAGELCLITS